MGRALEKNQHPYQIAAHTAFVIAANFIVLFGVLVWGWKLFDIFYLYWLENVIIGVITAGRMLLLGAAWGIPMLIGTLFFVAFFTFHYGMFCFGHGVIMFDLFYEGPLDPNEDSMQLFLYPLTVGTHQSELMLAIIALGLVEIMKGLQDRAKDKQQARIPKNIMFSPYGRIIVLHVTIIFGGLVAQKFGSPLWALAVLILLKTTYDLLTGPLKPNKKATEEKAEEI